MPTETPTRDGTRYARIAAIKLNVDKWVEHEEKLMGGFDDELPAQIRELQYLLRVFDNMSHEKAHLWDALRVIGNMASEYKGDKGLEAIAELVADLFAKDMKVNVGEDSYEWER